MEVLSASERVWDDMFGRTLACDVRASCSVDVLDSDFLSSAAASLTFGCTCEQSQSARTGVADNDVE
jgi:hypothetical protein